MFLKEIPHAKKCFNAVTGKLIITAVCKRVGCDYLIAVGLRAAAAERGDDANISSRGVC